MNWFAFWGCFNKNTSISCPDTKKQSIFEFFICFADALLKFTVLDLKEWLDYDGTCVYVIQPDMVKRFQNREYLEKYFIF